MLGLKRGDVQLRTYSELWADEFRDEERRLRHVFGQNVPIEHIGSTSVPGLAAKPIIDIQVGLDGLEESYTYIRALGRLGYNYMPERDTPYELFMPKGSEARRTHYLHIMENGSARWNDSLLFRDYLRAHDDARDAYAELKNSLASTYAHDRASYTAAKSEFIAGILARAREELLA